LFTSSEWLEDPDCEDLRWCEYAPDRSQVHAIPGLYNMVLGADEQVEGNYVENLAKQLRVCMDESLQQ
jgi:hypothetical protein